jgi:hypothetical protein
MVSLKDLLRTFRVCVMTLSSLTRCKADSHFPREKIHKATIQVRLSRWNMSAGNKGFECGCAAKYSPATV